jgi:hypothetical protein
MTPEQEGLLFEALELGAGIFLSAEAAGLLMSDVNLALRDPEWSDKLHGADNAGKALTARIEKYRETVGRFDESMEIINEKAKRFREYRKALQGTQIGLHL